jgi:hypothetical protein
VNRLSGACRLVAMTLAVGAVCLSTQVAADGPPLPAGPAPTDADEPSLPVGLGGDTASSVVEAGIADDTAGKPGLVRFWDTRVGIRTQDDDRVDDDFTLAETRLRLEYEQQWERAEFVLKSDLLLDALADDSGIDIEKREGWLQLREAKLGLQPHSDVDMALGRQVLTWGTGDLIFINDLFPKDYNSFFIGRAEEYLKSPVDALRVSVYSDLLNIDLVYAPRFDSNLYLDPERLSFFGSPSDTHLPVDMPDDWFSDDEFYLRANRRFGSWELALYGYDGFRKGPEGFDTDRQVYLFPKLAVYGASARGPLASGIFNIEYGYYDSKDAGLYGNSYAPPSEQRLLLGYERELARELNLGLQYYLTHIEDYGEYQDERLPGSPDRDRYDHVVTARLSKLLMNQDLRLSLFVFVSPSDEDGYLRPQLHYKLDDRRSVEAGANVFFGEDNETSFGQLRDNTNIYTAFRYDY